MLNIIIIIKKICCVYVMNTPYLDTTVKTYTQVTKKCSTLTFIMCIHSLTESPHRSTYNTCKYTRSKSKHSQCSIAPPAAILRCAKHWLQYKNCYTSFYLPTSILEFFILGCSCLNRFFCF